MKYFNSITIFSLVTILLSNSLLAQDISICKVEVKNLSGTYTGECDHGLANGKGNAKGIDSYIGLFKDGLPNGKGTYYYSDTIFYSGNFQDGIKEGKGEMHYKQNGKGDRLVKGYWSGDEYRGNSYITYNFNGEDLFDLVDINPSDESGKTVTMEISTTSGTPNNAGSLKGGLFGGHVLTITELTAIDGNYVRKLSGYTTDNKFSVDYEISKFPIKLQAVLSDGRLFDFELYKAAKWKIRLYKNT